MHVSFLPLTVSQHAHSLRLTPFLTTALLFHLSEKAQRSHEEAEASRTKETERELSECVSVMESSLRSALSAVLEAEMKAAFGDLWLEVTLA